MPVPLPVVYGVFAASQAMGIPSCFRHLPTVERQPSLWHNLAGHLNAEQLELLRDNQARHGEAVQSREIVELMQVDVEFHQLLCRFPGNDEIIQVMQQLCDKVQYLIRRVSEQFPQRITETYDEHRAILQAQVDNNGSRAAELVHQHLENGLRRFWSR